MDIGQIILSLDYSRLMNSEYCNAAFLIGSFNLPIVSISWANSSDINYYVVLRTLCARSTSFTLR